MTRQELIHQLLNLDSEIPSLIEQYDYADGRNDKYFDALYRAIETLIKANENYDVDTLTMIEVGSLLNVFVKEMVEQYIELNSQDEEEGDYYGGVQE